MFYLYLQVPAIKMALDSSERAFTGFYHYAGCQYCALVVYESPVEEKCGKMWEILPFFWAAMA